MLAAAGRVAARPEVGGQILEVDGDAAVRAAYGAWDAQPCSINAVNNVVAAVNAVVARFRAASPSVRYVTLLGSDDALPMMRRLDPVTISNETEEAADLLFTLRNGNANALYAAAALGYFLSDSVYGAFTTMPWLGRDLYLPNVAVGRLVETSKDIERQLLLYESKGGLLDPESTLTTAYDFLTDGGEAVAAGLAAARRCQQPDQRDLDRGEPRHGIHEQPRPGRRPLRQRALQPLAPAAGGRLDARLDRRSARRRGRVRRPHPLHHGLPCRVERSRHAPRADPDDLPARPDARLDAELRAGAFGCVRRQHRFRVRRHRRERVVRAADVDLRREDPRRGDDRRAVARLRARVLRDRRHLRRVRREGTDRGELLRAAVLVAGPGSSGPSRRRGLARERPGLGPSGCLAQRLACADGAHDAPRPLLGGDEPPDARDPLPPDPAARRRRHHAARPRRDRRDHQVSPDA